MHASHQISQHGVFSAEQMSAPRDIKADAMLPSRVMGTVPIETDPGAVTATPIGQAGQGAGVLFRRHRINRKFGQQCPGVSQHHAHPDPGFRRRHIHRGHPLAALPRRD